MADKPTRMRIASVTIRRVETLRLTVRAPDDWDAEAIEAAIGDCVEQVEDKLPLGMGKIALEVRSVTLGSRACDDPEWKPLDLTTLEPPEPVEDDEDEDVGDEDSE
jgi:hypothetical protein